MKAVVHAFGPTCRALGQSAARDYRSSCAWRRSPAGVRLPGRRAAGLGRRPPPGRRTSKLSRTRWRRLSSSRSKAARASDPRKPSDRASRSRGSGWLGMRCVCRSSRIWRRFSTRRRKRYDASSPSACSRSSTPHSASDVSARCVGALSYLENAPAVQELQRLYHELDVPNPTRPELDIEVLTRSQ